MSDSIKCDACGKSGRRLRRRYCPEGWFYALSTADEGYDQFVLSVCSQECRDQIWKSGPGLFTVEEMLNPVTPPPMPASDPEELLSALVDTMLRRGLSSVKIDDVSGKWMIVCTSKDDTYVGCSESIAKAFKDAFEHQDIHNG